MATSLGGIVDYWGVKVAGGIWFVEMWVLFLGVLLVYFCIVGGGKFCLLLPLPDLMMNLLGPPKVSLLVNREDLEDD